MSCGSEAEGGDSRAERKKNGVVQMLRKKKERKNETFGEKKKGF